MADWLVYGIMAVFLLLVFFLYLLVRRTVTGFKEGMESSQRERK